MTSIGHCHQNNNWAAAQNVHKERQTKANWWGHDPTPEEVKRKGENREANFAESLNDVQRPEHAKNGRGLIEVSLRDPWPPDDPLRQECDQFLKIFEDTYHEVLAEMDMAPQSGDYSSVVMSKKDLDEISRRMVEKLNANPEARELMSVLRVDFSGDLKTRPPKNEKPADLTPAASAQTEALDEEAEEAVDAIYEEWRKKYQAALESGEKMNLFDFWNNSKHKETASDASQVSRASTGPGLDQNLSAWLKSELAKNAWYDKAGGVMSRFSRKA
jgi:hypothetical protein